jgi:hypothetical protein
MHYVAGVSWNDWFIAGIVHYGAGILMEWLIYSGIVHYSAGIFMEWFIYFGGGDNSALQCWDPHGMIDFIAGMEQLAAWHYQSQRVAGLSPYSLTTPMARFSPGGSLLHSHPGTVEEQ